MTSKTIARYTVLVPLFIIPFVPLYVANELFFPFITGKGFAFRILVEIALAGYVLLALLDAKYRPKFSWVLTLYATLVSWMVLANALAINPHKAFWSNFERMDGFVTLVHVFVFFVILATMMAADNLWRRWWFFFLTGAALICGYSLFQLAGMAEIHQGSARVDATFGNAAYLAVYMLFATAISLWQGLESKGWVRYTLISFSAITAFILFTTETRGAVLGLAGAIGLGSILWMLEAGKKKTRLAAGAVFLGLIVVGGLFFTFKDSDFIKQDPTLARISSISLEEGKTRFALWDMALVGVAERPVFGWGQEGFNYVFQKYYRPSLYAQEPWFDRAHNTYIDWLIAGGAPALLLFIGLLVSAVVALYRKTVSRPERIILVSALAAYAFQALFVFDNLMSYVALAALLAVAHTLSDAPIKKLEDLPEVKSSTASSVAAPIILALGVGLIWMVNVPSITQAQKMVDALGQAQKAPAETLALFKEAVLESGLGRQEAAEQFMTFATGMRGRSDISDQTKDDIAKSALTLLDAEVARTPNDARLRVQYATGLRAFGKFDLALAQSQKALELSPKKQTIMIERGFAYWEAEKIQEARDVFVAMYELDTSFQALSQYAAAGEVALGRHAEANAILMKAYGTTEVDSEVLIVAYYQAKRYDDLVAALKRHLAADPSLQSYLRLASAYVVSGRTQEARATAHEALQMFPSAAATITSFMGRLP